MYEYIIIYEYSIKITSSHACIPSKCNLSSNAYYVYICIIETTPWEPRHFDTWIPIGCNPAEFRVLCSYNPHFGMIPRCLYPCVENDGSIDNSNSHPSRASSFLSMTWPFCRWTYLYDTCFIFRLLDIQKKNIDNCWSIFITIVSGCDGEKDNDHEGDVNWSFRSYVRLLLIHITFSYGNLICIYDTGIYIILIWTWDIIASVT